MANQADIAIKVTADTSSAERGLNQFNVSVKQTGSRIDSVITTLGKFGVASFGIKSVTDAFNALKNAAVDCVQTFAVQEQAEAKLNATLQATDNAIGMSATELKNLASSLQSVTTYGDETIIGMESLIISTQKISKDILPEVTERALDMAAALGTDATSAAQSLARALADPINNLRVLKSSNILLTEAQQDQIKSLQEQGDLLGAQRIILDKVASAYGGMARSIAETDTGKLQQIKNVWGDIKEGLGKSLLDTISPALDELYESVNKVYSVVEAHNKNRATRKQVEAILETNSADGLGMVSDEVLQGILDNTAYMNWKTEAERSGIDTSDKELIERGIQVGLFTQEEIDLVNAVKAEQEARKKAAEAIEEQRKALENLSLLDEKLLQKQSGVKTATEEIILPAINDEIAAAKVQASERESARLANSQAINSFIDQYAPMSDSEKRIKELNSLINEAQNLRWSGDSQQKSQLEEMIALWQQEIREIQTASDETEKAKMSATELAFEMADSATSIISSFSDIWSNIGDNLESQLEKLTESWEKYFDSLERKQDTQKDSLSMALSQGLISYEEYVSARQDLDDEYNDKQKQAEQEKESLRKKADAAKKAAFEADKVNAIAQIGISAAQAIMNAWKYDPVTAGILTGLISATSVAQIAAVSSKQYTPLAAGGIVSSPTHALIGEGGSKEAILPLNEDSFRKAGLVGENGSKIVLNFNFGNVYSKEELTSDIFEAVEMAQRTGALPNWSYVG